MRYEIKVRTSGDWVEVTEYIFRSWTGPRRLNGVAYTGPSYYLGSNVVAVPAA